MSAGKTSNKHSNKDQQASKPHTLHQRSLSRTGKREPSTTLDGSERTPQVLAEECKQQNHPGWLYLDEEISSGLYLVAATGDLLLIFEPGDDGVRLAGHPTCHVNGCSLRNHFPLFGRLDNGRSLSLKHNSWGKKSENLRSSVLMTNLSASYFLAMGHSQELNKERKTTTKNKDDKI